MPIFNVILTICSVGECRFSGISERAWLIVANRRILRTCPVYLILLGIAYSGCLSRRANTVSLLVATTVASDDGRLIEDTCTDFRLVMYTAERANENARVAVVARCGIEYCSVIIGFNERRMTYARAILLWDEI